MHRSTRLYNYALKRLLVKQLITRTARRPPRLGNQPFVRLLNILPSLTVQQQRVSGRDVVTLENYQPTQNRAAKPHLFFLHGGGYVYEAAPTHWLFLRNILKHRDYRISFVDYPLAPEHNYQDTFAMVSHTYDTLTAQYPDDDFILIGDSAGGGLALAFSQQLIQQSHPHLPIKNILLSPWLELSLSHPDIADLLDDDVILSRQLLDYCAKHYAAGDDMQQYQLSPINGDYADCPPTLVVYSDKEIFYPDCEALKARSQQMQLSQFYFACYQGLMHDWGINPIVEARQLVSDICHFIDHGEPSAHSATK